MTEEATHRQMRLAEEIQFLYPTEPNWSDVDNDTLVALIRDFASEPSCATTALGLLKTRRDARANELAQCLLLHEQADRWLKAAAQDVLDGE